MQLNQINPANILVQLEKMKFYDALRVEANQLNRTKKTELVLMINEILSKFNCPLINENQIKFYPQYIGNTGIGTPIDKQLTKIIYDHYYPAAKSGTYAHFTNLEALDGITNQRKLRLTSTYKRKDDLEFALFYVDHNIEGFKNATSTSASNDELMKNLFYISLTADQAMEIDIQRGIWDYFGVQGTGVKLIFDIETEHIDFRDVHYPNPKKTKSTQLFSRLENKIYSTFRKHLLFNSISKVGSFYIDSKFKDEFETRFLIKNLSDDYFFNFEILNFNGIPYIELDFISEWAKIEPVKVQPGAECDCKLVQEILKKNDSKAVILPNATHLQ